MRLFIHHFSEKSTLGFVCCFCYSNREIGHLLSGAIQVA